MKLKDKSILVLGLGISGISIIKTLDKEGAKIIVSDCKSREELADILEEIADIPIEYHFDGEDFSYSDIDLIIKSPGIPPNSYFVEKAVRNNILLITDLELAYRCFFRENLVAITGSNGKTTTTVITGEIFRNAGFNTHVVGNIGTAILDKISTSYKDDIFIIETSSFQLEHTVNFKPKVSLITNISEDHIDWHGSIENYIKSKFKIFANQDKNDYLILNYDDEILRQLEGQISPKIIWFSTREELDDGIYCKGDKIIVNSYRFEKFYISLENIKIKGRHNIENILASIAIALTYKINSKVIIDTLEKFKGLEHRLEFVRRINGIDFYNDSKATNILSSIKAIEAIESPIILIAGGYNKNSYYQELIDSFDSKVKCLILLGETKEIIRSLALKSSFCDKDIYIVDTIEEAVNLAYNKAKKGDNILLSPASASWDQYKSFEERGKDFKRFVLSLVE